ncbi:MAG: metalloprotease PmbA [Candidatus Polarisedimenticolaceae bacterium]|nr:metalloprotease PmbA [Candidatus Polarisedimenticolaceae bacterium]
MNDLKRRQSMLEQMVEQLLSSAKQQGATAAEAVVSRDSGFGVSVRMGEVETVEHTQDNALGVTVYFGQRKGTASTSDFSHDAIEETVKAACNFARYTSEDPCSGLADAELMATDVPDLDLYHPWAVEVDEAIAIALRCEDAARATDPRISNSEGADVSSHSGLHVYGNSHGFVGGYPTSRHSLSCSVLSQQGDSMERDYWYTSARCSDDLEVAEEVGQRAAQRALARLGGRRLTTRQSPIIFQAEVASGLLGSLLGAISGSALYRQASFLLDHLGKPIFPDFVHIHEEPLLKGAAASAPFDNEGVATYAKDLVTDGVLSSYLLGSYSARKLGMQTTANAGGIHNLRIDSGDLDHAALLKEMDRGLLVTELMGQGSNPVTGDYSRGASGFWVENGEIQYPVHEITIAGNLKQMYQDLLAIGSDIDRRGSIQTGSWLIREMTIAGE